MSNQIFNPRELAEMARFYEEVRHARLRGSLEGQRGPANIIPPEVRPLRGLPSSSRGASVVLQAGEVERTLLEVRPQGQDAEVMTLVAHAAAVNTGFSASPFVFAPLNDAVIEGTLVWGIGQITFTAAFDIYRGTVISVPANYLRLSATYQSVAGPGGSPPFQVSAAVGYGAVQMRSAPARFTQDLGLVGAPVLVQIPPWAVAFNLQLENVAAVTTILMTKTIPSGSLTTFTHAAAGSNAANQEEQQYPIFNGAERLSISNSVASETKIVYTLAI